MNSRFKCLLQPHLWPSVGRLKIWPKSVQEDKSTCFWVCLWPVSKTTTSDWLNKFSRSSNSPWLWLRVLPQLPAHTHTHTHTTACIWPCSTCRHTYNLFIRQTDRHTHSSQHLHADLHCSSADCSRAASVCSMFEWAGGEGGDLEVGQGFQETSTAPSQELLSCLRSLPLNNCLPHTSCKTPCRGKVIPGEGANRSEPNAPSSFVLGSRSREWL